ncbi:MAG: ABC transporter substrate-binding protein [Parafannyhessea sp.]|uniref:ABC transporter substrate-binding protein n=1 Tax=Parafannyhessea sp. TaxID=2847324 RepID=UPI003F116AFB
MLDRREFLTCSLGMAGLFLAGCSTSGTAGDDSSSSGTSASAKSSTLKVVALSESLADIALLSGAKVVGYTSDAAELKGIPSSAKAVGTLVRPNLEQIVALKPDLVLLSADIPPQAKLESGLRQAKISYKNVLVNSFADYRKIMRTLTGKTGRSDLYNKNVTKVASRIAKVRKQGASLPKVTYLAIRMSSSTERVLKSGTHFACEVFDGMRMTNVATDTTALDNLSVEAIVAANPHYILVTPMGDETEAQDAFKQAFESKPGWSTLDAVKAGRVHMLPKDLFQLKPNERWDEAYRYVLDMRKKEG